MDSALWLQSSRLAKLKDIRNITDGPDNCKHEGSRRHICQAGLQLYSIPAPHLHILICSMQH